MKRLLLLLPLLLMLPASAQTLTKEQTAEWRRQIYQHYENFSSAGQAENWPMACAALQKQAAILNTVMTDLQFHFPETNWMGLSNMVAKSLREPYCRGGGYLVR